MQITITIADADWEQFQAVAQQAVEQSWDGSYEDFATYIMAVNLETYIKAQQKKQEKQRKRALANDEASLAQETTQSVVIPAEPPQRAPVKPRSSEHKQKAMTNTEIAERIAQLEQVAVKRRSLAQAQELHDLLILRKKQATKKE